MRLKQNTLHTASIVPRFVDPVATHSVLAELTDGACRAKHEIENNEKRAPEFEKVRLAFKSRRKPFR